ncbi:MAG: carboxypeptidase-like regulatory domain-containing protein [Acidobacteriaceae bacterium]
MRNLALLIFTGILAGALAVSAQSQSIGTSARSPGPTASKSSPTSSPREAGASVAGTVAAPDGHVIVGAVVTLVSEPSRSQQITLTDDSGSFHFSGLPSGAFQITVTANGFAPWVGPEIVLNAQQQYQAPEISLDLASTSTTVHAVFTGHDLAEQQMHVEEKQRILGVFPNFYTSYVWKAEPLTSGQKFRLAFRTSIDPVNFIWSGAIAGIEQADDDFNEYGQGVAGYAKRYGANYSDQFIGTMVGGAILPSVLHQDPRYFYKGTGSIRSRALYALSTVFICRGDNGRWQPNYSNVLGTVASAGISNAYYPSNDRGLQLTIDNSLIDLALGGATALLQEFVLRSMSRGVPAATAGQH